MVAPWLSFGLCKTGFIKLNGKNSGYTAAIAEAEVASERAAAPALKRDVASTHWAWGKDFVTTFQDFSAWATSALWRHCMSGLD
jgi:hypothetical protein